MIIKPVLFYDKSIILKIKGKLLWSFPCRKDVSTSFMQNLEWPPLAVRDRQIFNYKRMDMPLIQLKRQGGCRKKAPGATKRTHRWEKRPKERFWKIREERGCTMGINKSMSHFKRVGAACCTKTLSGGDGVLVDNKDQDFEFCHFKIKSGWWFRCKKECNHLQTEENIVYSCFFISNRKEITTLLSNFRVRHSVTHRQHYRSWKSRHIQQKQVRDVEEEVETERDNQQRGEMKNIHKNNN